MLNIPFLRVAIVHVNLYMYIKRAESTYMYPLCFQYTYLFRGWIQDFVLGGTKFGEGLQTGSQYF